MKFTVNYWHNPSGKSPVEKYIDDMDNKEERAELLSILTGIQEYLKKTPKAPLREIETARQRLKQLIGD